MSRVLKVSIGLIGVAGLVLAALALQFNRFLATPVAVPEAGAELLVRPGVAFRQVSTELGERAITSS